MLVWYRGRKKISFYRMFWTRGQTIGEVIHASLVAAKALSVTNPLVKEVELIDLKDLPPTALTENGGITFNDSGIYSFLTEDWYRLSYGVVYSFQDYGKDAVTVGYGLSEENKVFKLAVVAEEVGLFNLYLELAGTLPQVDAFWFQLHEDWEEGGEAFYVTEDLTSR